MAKSQVDDGSFCNIQQAKALMHLTSSTEVMSSLKVVR